MHEHATATVWIGGDDVTTANGFAALLDKVITERYPVDNSNKMYLISDTVGVSVKMLWGE